MVVVSWADAGYNWGQNNEGPFERPAKLFLVQINSKLASWKCAHLLTEGNGG